MKKGVLSLLASIFFLLLFVFISYYYSPFDQASIEEYIDKYGITEESEFKEIIYRNVKLGVAWEFIDFHNLFAWIVALGGMVICSFVSVHIAIDKFFFKDYSQRPDFLVALRRGVLFFFIVSIFLSLHLLGAFVWYTATISVVLLVLVEWGITSIRKPSRSLPTR